MDGCARGFGAGAGNAQLEVLVAVLNRMGYETGIDFYKLLDAADLAEAAALLPNLRNSDDASRLCEFAVTWVKRNPVPLALGAVDYQR